MHRRAILSAIGAGLAALPLTRLHALPEPAPQGITRRYIRGAFGQIHLRVAMPDPEKITAPPLVALHQTALSGRMFDHFLPVMARDRMVIAPDTPGYGESDRPAERPPLEAYGDAILDALLREYGGPFDLLGYHTGAAIAADLAARRDMVRKTVLVSMPYFGDERRNGLVEQIDRPRGYNDEYSEDGSHLPPMWEGTFKARPEGQSWDDVARLVSEKQRAGRWGGWALLSALEIDLTEKLQSIDKPVLVIAPHDGLDPQSRAAAEVIPAAQLIELPDLAYGLFDATPERIADPARAFLNA
ncbi:alpha/beta fold hydrolase [Altererythrobacter sp. MF3-039]|uniref:alpha/beta fold hydrolase n=1 Tax=Altererythrobacter sp. MF3-039 TaxID=3252901 RepID=UPI00390C5DC8